MILTYLFPTGKAIFEEEIKKSKFLTYLKPIVSKEDAFDFIAEVKQKFPDARHHCWAYIVGNPHNTGQLGMSDDGEPHGTAGKPMLSTLQSKNIGDLVVVTVRYFGGTLLGTGGLVRAYTSGVTNVLQKCGIEEKITRKELTLIFPFASENAIRRFISQNNFTIGNINYTHSVELTLSIPEGAVEIFRQDLANFTNGQCQINN